jgi:hypothetical protein
VTKWFAVFVVVFAAAACVNTPSNSPGCSPNFSPGDRFKITINFLEAGETPCSLISLSQGYSFVVTAGIFQLTDTVDTKCYDLAATPEIPPFAAGLMRSCSSGIVKLGVECEGLTSDGCDVIMGTGVSSVPSSSQGITEHAQFRIGWTDKLHEVGKRCVPEECGVENYDVRIERLAPGSDGGD